MYTVNPLDRDRFHLRLLLLHQKGPQSFQDIRIVEGIVYQTNAGAAIALGLLENDQAWASCLIESAGLDTPRQQRYLFVMILVFCEPTNPLSLYQTNEANLMEDFNQRFQNISHARAACLDAIGSLPRENGKTHADYDLPLPDVALLEPDPENEMFDAIDAAVRWTH